MQHILVTGAGGFIGSNLVGYLLERGCFVRALDNFLTGFRENLQPYLGHPHFELLEGDLRDLDTCMRACAGMQGISHQAALGSVPRSVKEPYHTIQHNINGFVNLAFAAKEQGIRRLVYASSSSVYGDHPALPKREEAIGRPLSPYAISKYADELFAQNFAQLYGLDCIGFRYFNIFGPRQSATGAYAAVIPLFIQAALKGGEAFINGDGGNSRDFTYVENVLQANWLALQTQNPQALNQVYNIGCGGQYSLLELWDTIAELTQTAVKVQFREARAGDIVHSRADISKAQRLLGYEILVDFKQGLAKTVDYWRGQY
jgi:UDP-N-acetylglucosamine 4-epimerase